MYIFVTKAFFRVYLTYAENAYNMSIIYIPHNILPKLTSLLE